jgi:hypothetical protein
MFIRSEHDGILNTMPDTSIDDDLLDVALGHLRDADLRVSLRKDAVLALETPAGTQQYEVQLKRRVSPSSAAAVTATGDRRPLVVSPYISPSVADIWRRQDVHYVDSAGNMFLRWPGLLVDVRGRPQPPSGRARALPLRAFQPSGLRILFVLLTEPDSVRRSYRDIAYSTSTSLGTVQWVFRELERVGFLHTGDEGRQLHRVSQLFDRWVEAYGLDLFPRLSLGHFDSTDDRWWVHADEAMRAEGALWGGELAAHLLDSHLRPATATVYATGLPRRLILDHRLRKADDGGNVEVRQRFWTLPPPAHRPIVPSTLIYADLVASGDPRQLEAAATLREQDELLRRLDGSPS